MLVLKGFNEIPKTLTSFKFISEPNKSSKTL